MPDESLEVDKAIVAKIRARDEVGLRTLMAEYGPRVKGYLLGRFGKTLAEQDIDEVFSEAVVRAWLHIDSFDFAKGKLRAWVLKIAHRVAVDFITERKKHATVPLDLEQLSSPPVDDPADPLVNADARQRAIDLDFVIENNLKGLQQAIIKADLLSGDVARAELLANQYGTSTNSIYVSRLKARANIKLHMQELADERARQK